MPTPTDPKTDNPIQKGYDDEFNRIARENQGLDEDGNRIIADAERKAESGNSKSDTVNPLKNTDNNSEKSWYNSNFPNNQTTLGRAKTAFKLASRKKKTAGIGGIVAIIISMGAFFSFLTTFQLIHLAEMMGNIFDAQTERNLNRRVGKHYQIIFDQDGKGAYHLKEGKIKGRLTSGYASLNTTALINDLKEKGVDLSRGRDGKLRLNGVEIEGKLSDKRNAIKAELNRVYGNDNGGFIKRSMRSRTAFKSMGIQRTFFENTKSKVDNWELEMIRKMRQRLGLNDESSRVTINGVTDDATQTEANEIRESVADPTKDPAAGVERAIGDVEVNAGNITDALDPKALAGSVGVGALQLDQAAQTACGVKFRLKATELAIVLIRHRGLVKNAAAILVAAHQLKTGKNVSAKQVSAIMQILNKEPGIGASGSWQLLAGNQRAKVKNADLYTFDLLRTSGAGGALATFNKKLDDTLNTWTLGKGDDYCGISRTGAYQVVSTGVGFFVQVVAAIGSGGTSLSATAAKIAVSAGISVAFNIVLDILQSMIAQSIAGPAAVIGYGESQTGDKSMDALAGGVLAISSAERYQNGMTERLSQEQVAEIETNIALDKAENMKNIAIKDKYFSLNNADSKLSMQLASMPSSPKLLAQKSMATISDLPAKFAKSILLFSPQGKAKAQSVSGNPYLENNPLGIPMYGLSEKTADEIDFNEAFDPVENEEWIYNNGGIEAYQAWANECFPDDPNKSNILYGLPSNEDEETLINEKCTFGSGSQLSKASDVISSTSNGPSYTGVAGISTIDREKYLRYSTYRLDRTIQQGILFMSGQSDCTDPDSEDFNCTDSTESSTNTNNTNPSGWDWPIKKEDWPKSTMPIAECGLRYSNGTVHTGIDISDSSLKGKPVYAASNGVVSMRDDSYGSINIKTNEVDSSGTPLYINYQHMDSTLVNNGDPVVKGETIVGYVGNKGTSAVHLHFGIWKTNSFLSGHQPPSSSAGQAVISQILNPYDFMPKDGRNVSECN